MTTTVGFATRDCLVLGCDSLGTITAPVVHPFRIIAEFFDKNDGYKLRRDANGEPLLNDFGQLYQYAEDLAYNQLPSMTKLFSLEPAAAGVLFAGISVLSDRSIRELVESFRTENEGYLKGEYTLEELARRIEEHFKQPYEDTFNAMPLAQTVLELTVAGYSTKESKPEIHKILFSEGKTHVFGMAKPGEYNVIFGGQYDVCQRVVTGLDAMNFGRYVDRVKEIGNKYREKLLQHLDDAGHGDIELPEISDFKDDIGIEDDTWLNKSDVDLANFSEQAAIDFVDFLVETMIKAQEFSNRLQTVGGKVHIAIITKNNGFRWISKEEYTYRGYGVPKHEKHQIQPGPVIPNAEAGE